MKKKKEKKWKRKISSSIFYLYLYSRIQCFLSNLKKKIIRFQTSFEYFINSIRVPIYDVYLRACMHVTYVHIMCFKNKEKKKKILSEIRPVCK